MGGRFEGGPSTDAVIVWRAKAPLERRLANAPNIAANAASVVGRHTVCVYRIGWQTFLRNFCWAARCAAQSLLPDPGTKRMAADRNERARLLHIARAKPLLASNVGGANGGGGGRASGVVAAASNIRGVFCSICGVYGEHTLGTCPRKTNEGCPDNLRKRLRREGCDTAFVDHGPTSGGGSGSEAPPRNYNLPAPASIRPAYCDLPDDFLPAAELEVLVSKRPDVPSFLRCYACAVLARDAMWCACCDVLACQACLPSVSATYTGHDDDGHDVVPWWCPKCGCALRGTAADVEDDTASSKAYVVTSVRTIIDAWMRMTMEAIDPYSQAVAGVR